ncbi:hypothetical protein AVEN_83160-1 [Araneus ventricosus]|uniref:Uncharacterized protein n=1 Tax=Araneus ventricosus TaxID=182803 RepID=A0A4Y2AMI2_ARAVE|nr:hypothetical protein AVEN_83160-1 [Araneus ventricosus]
MSREIPLSDFPKGQALVYKSYIKRVKRDYSYSPYQPQYNSELPQKPRQSWKGKDARNVEKLKPHDDRKMSHELKKASATASKPQIQERLIHVSKQAVYNSTKRQMHSVSNI